jgi:outer membrane protein TolC
MRNGIFHQSDYLDFQLQIKSEQRQLRKLQASYYNDLILLNILSGIDDTTTVTLAKPDLIWKSGYTLQSDPKWLQFRIDSLQNETAKSLLAFNYKPQIALFADEGLNAVQIPGIYNHFGISAGISLSWTIADGGQRSLNLQKLYMQQNNIAFYKSFYQRQNALQVFSFEKQREQNQNLISDVQDNLKSMDQLLSMRKRELESGQISIIDYLSNLRDRISLQNQLTAVLLQQQQIISDHNQLVW